MGALAGIVGVGQGEIRKNISAMLDEISYRGANRTIYDLGSNGLIGIGSLPCEERFGNRFIDEYNSICVAIDGGLTSLPLEICDNDDLVTDAKCIYELYLRKGELFLHDIDGSFAIVLWDGRKKELFLIRDRFGTKPLFYQYDQNKTIFASELKSIIASKLSLNDVDIASINNFLTYGYITNPDSMFKSILQVQPGHYLKVTNGGIKEHTYWQFQYKYDQIKRTRESYREEFYEKLVNSVKKRIKKYPECGAFLSGGLDSSSVVATMHHVLNKSFKCFTGAFSEAEYDESSDAKVVANHFGLDHYVANIEIADEFPKLVEKLVWHHDSPFADTSAIPSYFIAMHAKKHVNAVLTGDFPDQLLGGSGHHVKSLRRQMSDNQILRILRSRWVHNFINELPMKAGSTTIYDRIKRFLYRESFPLHEQRLIIDMPVPELLKRCLYTKDMLCVNRSNDPMSIARTIFERVKDKRLLDKLLYFDIESYAPDDLMVKVDRMSMAHGLITVSPFHDLELVEYVACLPEDQKINGDSTKHIMREALKQYLPYRTLEKKKKGFDMPIKQWLMKRYPDYVRDVLLDQKSINRGYFRKDFLEKMLNCFIAGKADYATGSEATIFSLLTLELWHRKYVDKNYS